MIPTVRCSMRAVSRGSQRLTWLFPAIIGLAAVMLVWLGARLLRQDRDLYASRAVERQDASADGLVRVLASRLVAIERDLGDGNVPAGAILLTWGEDGLQASPADAVAWVPAAPPLRAADGGRFAEADAREARGNLSAALAASRALSRSDDAAVRSGALLRLARLSVKTGDIAHALEAYARLSREETVSFDGMPADLLARRYRCDLLQRHRSEEQFAREARDLATAFVAGRWALPRDAWELVADQLRGQFAQRLEIDSTRMTASLAIESLLRAGRRAPRQTLSADGAVLTILVREGSESWRAAILSPVTIGAWLNDHDPAAAVALHDDTGRRVAGVELPQARLARRSPLETGLPWTVVVGPVTGVQQDLRRRERFFASAIGSIVLLLVGGSYILWRGLRRELALARLQGDFVAAVSHEFRTPVTSLRHAIELLQEDDELPVQQRKAFYDVLGRNTERLHRLVESLLDFGRMEEGRRPFQLQAIDVTAVSLEIGREFQREVAARGYALDVEAGSGEPVMVLADRDALGHAIWNLLDNAIKYSPGGSRVCLAVRRQRDAVAIEVRDTGLGVPASERRAIFEKFVRGEQARSHGIKGTGVGLAIVSHVVRAHGGTVELDSEEGKGSTFRLVLPVTA
jgi:signal transduction histidine kinase